MAEVRVQCAGRPVVITGREAPTEYDVEPSCGWVDWSNSPSEATCPDCNGVVEVLRTAGAATPQPEAVAQTSAPPAPARRADGPTLAAPAHNQGEAVTLRFMAEWPPHAISEDERAAALAGAEALERVAELEAVLADQGSGSATQHHWKRAALRNLRRRYELERLALAYLDADGSHAAHQEAETALREALKDVRR
jgi:hypothetical protein